MNCEVEFLPVGEKSRAGDAIVIRYGEEYAYSLMLVDGGTEQTGFDITSHIRASYGAQAYFEHVVLTHPDADHASGLREVLKSVAVKNLWLHIPWAFAAEARPLFKDKRWTDHGLLADIKSAYPILAEIVDLAQKQGTNIDAPFTGAGIGPFRVLGPNRGTYIRLLPQFSATPEPDQDLLESLNIWIGKAPSGVFKALVETALTKVSNWIPETWAGERLQDGGVTSASNESSVILYADVSGQRYLLTGDAGINALTWAADNAVAFGYPLRSFTLVQIPHHGSRRNVGPTILNRLLGPILPMGTPTHFTAIVSAPKDDENHPRKIVTNAFKRRGAEVIATQGGKRCFFGGFIAKQGYGRWSPIEFFDRVEDYS